MTELEADQAAIVASAGADGVDIYLPATNLDQVPELFIVLCACAMRINSDPEWVEGMLNWFMAQGHGRPNNDLN